MKFPKETVSSISSLMRFSKTNTRISFSFPLSLSKSNNFDSQKWFFNAISNYALDEFNEISQTNSTFQLTERSTVTWTARISELVARHREDRAFEIFKLMLLQGERPNHVTLLTVIRAVNWLNSELLTEGIHGFVIKTGFDSEVSIITALLGLYSLYGCTGVFELFNQVPRRDVILWSALIAAYSKNGLFFEAIAVFRGMQCSDVEPNNVSVISAVNACADVGALHAGKQLHWFSLRKNFTADTNLQNSLVDMYAKCGKLDSSALVFDMIENKDLVSWNTMICGYAENGHPSKALAIFSAMLSSCLQPDDTTARAIIRACLKMGTLQLGLLLHCLILKSGLSNYVSVATALLTMYAEFGEVAISQALFDHLRHKDFVVWSAMVAVYARAGCPHLAIDTFQKMRLANEKANEVTLVSLLQACSLVGAQRHGKSIHAFVLRAGCSSNIFMASVLIDFYCKVGMVNQGKTLFERIPCKDVVCWSSMMNGYGVNGCGEDALETFYLMLKDGLQPNDVVFLSVLSACSHCGLVSEGLKWFSFMEQKYGVSPCLEHYACMVDLLSRQGRVNAAFEFINQMPMEPDASVWGALLAGCRDTNGTVEIAESAAWNLLRLDPDNTSYYVIVSNMYADCGRWGDVERLRRLLNEKRLRKTVGYSMVEAS